MARAARVVAEGYPHHVVQRGNRRLEVFFSDEDRRAYLSFLKNACERYGVKVWAYCLMDNHVHIIAVPKKADALARCFSDAHVRYTRQINKRQEWKGHLWQARFGSNVLDERYLLAAIRYVERNPVRAGMVKEAGEYRWSSAAWHMGKVSDDPLVTGDDMLKELIGNWRRYLHAADEKVFLEMIRREAYGTRPVGDERFVKRLERRYKCSLIQGTAGRPVKKEN